MQHKTRGSCHKGGRRFSKLNSKPLKVCPDALDVITSRPVLGLMINCPLYIDVCYIFFYMVNFSSIMEKFKFYYSQHCQQEM